MMSTFLYQTFYVETTQANISLHHQGESEKSLFCKMWTSRLKSVKYFTCRQLSDGPNTIFCWSIGYWNKVWGV